jgi:hypothetical protein
MLKRVADWLEKMSVAAMAVGLFQGRLLGVFIGILTFLVSLALTKMSGGKI